MDKALTFSDADAVSAESAGATFGAVIDHAADDKARVVLTRDGKPVAAIVPIEDYEALEAIEDAYDAKLAREAIAAWEAAGRPPGIPHEEVLAEYGITFE
jgi:prevent-host-death family protein